MTFNRRVVLKKGLRRLPVSPRIHPLLMRASAMVGMVQAQIKKSDTARLMMNLFPTVRSEGFCIAQMRASVLPEVKAVIILRHIVDIMLIYIAQINKRSKKLK